MKQTIVDFLDSHFVSDWRDWWHWWSTWTYSALTVWLMLPVVLQMHIPNVLNFTVSAVLWGSVVAARVWDQPKLDGEE